MSGAGSIHRVVLVVGVLCLAVLVAAGCDGEGTLFTIETFPDADGGPDPIMVYRTRALGIDEATQRTFTAYVELLAPHTPEFMTRGVLSKNDVVLRVFTFDGLTFTPDDIELRSAQRATVGVASGWAVATGQDQIAVPGGGGATQLADFFATGIGGGTIMAVANNRLVQLKMGSVDVELNFDQLQGMAKYIQRVSTPRVD